MIYSEVWCGDGHLCGDDGGGANGDGVVTGGDDDGYMVVVMIIIIKRVTERKSANEPDRQTVKQTVWYRRIEIDTHRKLVDVLGRYRGHIARTCGQWNDFLGHVALWTYWGMWSQGEKDFWPQLGPFLHIKTEYIYIKRTKKI